MAERAMKEEEEQGSPREIGGETGRAQRPTGKRSRGKLRHSANSSMNLNLLTYDPEAETPGGHCNSISLAYLKKTPQIHNFMFSHQSYLLYTSVFLCHFAPVIVQTSQEKGSSRKTEILTSGWNALQGYRVLYFFFTGYSFDFSRLCLPCRKNIAWEERNES